MAEVGTQDTQFGGQRGDALKSRSRIRPGRTGIEGLEARRTGDLRGRRYVQSAMCASTDAPAAGLNTSLSRLAP